MQWIPKKGITLQDISLSKQEDPKVAHEEVSTGKLVVAPIDASNEESTVESEEEPIESHDEIPQEGHENQEDPIEELEETPQEEYRNEEDPIEEHEEMPQEEHQNEEESIKFPSLKEPRVDMSKKEEPTTKFVAYHHPHHQEKQLSSSKG